MGKGSKIPAISTIFVLILLMGAFLVIAPDTVSADPTAPSAPTGLTAIPGDRQVVLTWSAPSDDGGSPITSYNMYRGTTSGGEVLITSVGNALTFTCTGRTNGVTYYFQITAVNAFGEGPRSNEASATPMAAPSAPTGLTATPGNQKVVLKWNAPSNDGGSDITQYNVYRSVQPGKETLLKELTNVLTYSDNGLNNGVTYYYKVSAVNVKGIGTQSNEANATPATVPLAPTLTSATPGDAQVVLAWTAPSNGGAAITNYSVYRGTTLGGETLFITLGDVLTYTDTGLTNGQTYHYKVKAVNSAGEGTLSNGLGARPVGAPSGPQGLLATPGDTYVNLTWQAPANDGGSAITNYKVWRGTTPDAETFLADAGLNLWFNDTGLTNGQIYYYKVSAVNSMMEGAPSNEVSSTPATVPSAPTLTSATPGDAQVVLAWTAPSNGGAAITNYSVYRGTTLGGGTLFITLGNVHTYTDIGLTNGQIYYYQVTAINSMGEGAPSNEASVTPDTVPTVPRDLDAVVGDTVVHLSWTTPTTVGTGTINYHLFRDGSEIWSGTGMTFSDTSVTNGVTYSYMVAAQNTIGWGPNCTAVLAAPQSGDSVPTAPIGLTVTSGDMFVDLSWAPPSYVGPGTITYHLFRDGSKIWSGADLSYTDTTVINAVTYSYTVAAQNTIGGGPNCTAVLATPISGDTVPSTPGSLMAEAGNELVDLEWNAPAYTGPGTITYHLFRDGVEIWSGTTMTYTDSMLNKGVQHSYTVAAQNSIGWGPNCTAVLTTPFGVPDAPWGLDAVPDDTRLSLGWNAMNYTGPGPLIYHLFRDGVEVHSGNITSYEDTGLMNGQTYVYIVVASNSIGWGANSSSASGSPQGPPSAPVGLIAETGDGFIELTWTAPDYIGPGTLTYHLFRNGSLLWSGTSFSHNDTAVINEIIYLYSVVSQNDLGWGTNSSTVSATPTNASVNPPGIPVGLEAEAGDGEILLTWEEPSQSGNAEITGYKIYRSTNSGSSFAFIGSASGLTFTDTNLTIGQTYWYKVSAVNAHSEGDQCSAVSETLAQLMVTLTGKVINTDGVGVPDITVSLENGTSVQTDGQGNFVIMTSTGEHTLTISGEDIETRTIVANVTSSGLDMDDITTTEPKDDSSNDPNDNLSLILVVGIIAAVLVAVLLIVHRRRSK